MKGILGKQMAREDRRQHPDWETFNKMDKQIDSKSPKSPTYPYLLTSARLKDTTKDKGPRRPTQPPTLRRTHPGCMENPNRKLFGGGMWW